MNKSQNTQLTTVEGYNPLKNMIFSEPVYGSIPDSKPKIEFRRINILTRNEDGSVGELILPTERLYSFGVSENSSQETGKITGYTFPLCMWSRDSPTKEEKAWTDTFDKIVNHCIDHLVEHREEIEMYDLTHNDLKKSKGGLNPLYWKKEKQKDPETGKVVLKPVPGKGPTLYTKLIYSKKNNRFVSQFFDKNDEQINATDLMGKHCYATSAIKIESIFIGAKISLQIKLYETVVELANTGVRRLLSRNPKVLVANKEQTTAESAIGLDNDDDDDDSGSLHDSSEEEEVVKEEKPAPKKRIVRRLVKKVVKK